MRALLDTSVLIAEAAPTDVEAAISVISISELHVGTLLARDDDEHARRTDRLAAVEATFDPLLVTVEGARPRRVAGSTVRVHRQGSVTLGCRLPGFGNPWVVFAAAL